MWFLRDVRPLLVLVRPQSLHWYDPPPSLLIFFQMR